MATRSYCHLQYFLEPSSCQTKALLHPKPRKPSRDREAASQLLRPAPRGRLSSSRLASRDRSWLPSEAAAPSTPGRSDATEHAAAVPSATQACTARSLGLAAHRSLVTLWPLLYPWWGMWRRLAQETQAQGVSEPPASLPRVDAHISSCLLSGGTAPRGCLSVFLA